MAIQKLLEMARVCKKLDGFGFIAEIYSNEHDPAHIHIKDYDNKELGQILLTDEIPQTKDDIQVYKGNN